MNPTFRFALAPPTTRLTIEGELDLSSWEQLSWRLAEAGRLCDHVLELDVAGVTFIDCDGLRPIERTRRLLETSGKRLDVTAASRCFRRVSLLAGYGELAIASSTPGAAEANRN